MKHLVNAIFLFIFSIITFARGQDAVYIGHLSTSSGTFTFALNIADPVISQDVYFHMSGPSGYSWIGVGTGTMMQDSLMFVVYSNAVGDGITLSPRLGYGNNEPVFSSSLDVEVLPGSNISSDTMAVNARCRNCDRWSTGSLNLNDTAYPWFYALGSNSVDSVKLRSDSPSAGLEMHVEYGRFNVDMTVATGGSGGIPTSVATPGGATAAGAAVLTSNYPSIIHAVLITIPLTLFMPIGIMFLRISPGSVRWHWVNQTLSSIMALVGGLIGIFVSTLFNKSKSFNSGHQILGFLVCAAMIFQWALGFWHHRLYKRTPHPTSYGLIHRYLGHIIFILAIINAGVGLSWSSASAPVVIGYSVGVGIVAITVFAILAWKRWRSKYISRSSRRGSDGLSLEPINKLLSTSRQGE